uniref:AAA+ ATPase domain-containing protein n=1 Tax=Tetradesmus obliquus TaxID=3088 RepID=A0A383VRP6_TETOB
MQLGQRAALPGCRKAYISSSSLPGSCRIPLGLCSLPQQRAAAKSQITGVQQNSSRAPLSRPHVRLYATNDSQQSSSEGPQQQPEQQQQPLEQQQERWQQHAEQAQQQQQQQQASSRGLLQFASRMLGSLALLAVAAGVSARPSYAAPLSSDRVTTQVQQRSSGSSSSSRGSNSSSSSSWRLSGIGDVADADTATAPSKQQVDAAIRSSPELQKLIAARKRAWYDSRPHLAGSGVYEAALHGRLGVPLDFEALNTSMVYAPGDVQESGVYEAALHSRLGVPLDFDALNTSMVYAPGDVQESGVYEAVLHGRLGVPLDFEALNTSMVYAPGDVQERKDRGQIYTFLNAMLNQYDNEDFDLGIKQFMIEQAIQQEMEDGLDKKGDAKDFEEKLAEQLFADEGDGEKIQVRSSDIGTDAFTTEKMEEAAMVVGPQASLRTAWRVQEHLQELSYTQLWTLVGEGHVDALRLYGPEQSAAIVTLKASAPGGARQCKVVLAPDPDLAEHLLLHGVMLTHTSYEGDRLQRAFLIQIARYTMPFVAISAIFWLLHTWILDPVPNKFRRREFIRYRREILHVGTKLNFRSPARQVFIDTSGPEFIGWDDINGIDEVKAEIEEIIDYLKNPALLRLRGVSRIGGVLLAGAPGTGKTLLAKAIAAESGVKMFTCSGTDFYDVYTGVGARRIRETFEMLRNFAPAVLFVDEFDALGAARGAAAAGDESASIINELLVQMDGFEDNRGLVVLGATNRPGAIDAALIRPGRFDRIIYMPLPDAEGRAEILQVHARNKSVDPTINWQEVARAMSGFTGADCMGLMARAARMAARQGREAISEEDIYAAMENKAMEAFQELSGAPQPGYSGLPDPIPASLRKSIAVYEAGKALVAYITPEYDEIARVSICPYNMITGYTLFVEDEAARANALLSRGDMEGVMVVHLAGRAAEKMVMGEAEMTGLCAPDLFHANMVAREMVLSAGMGRKIGPMDLMSLHPKASEDSSGDLLRTLEPKDASEEEFYYHASDMPTEMARVALSDVLELLEAAEAKAAYGLAINWKPLQALVDALLQRGVLQGKEVAHILETNGVIHFPDPYTVGFGWEDDGSLLYPFKPRPEGPNSPGGGSSSGSGGGGAGPDAGPDAGPSGGEGEEKELALAGAAAKTWYAGSEFDAPRKADGKFEYGWHWNSPFRVKRDVPDLFRKEVERYVQ